MSDDENIYTRTSIVDRYLYGDNDNSTTSITTETNISTNNNTNNNNNNNVNKQRSKSHDVPKSDDFYKKTKTKIIERGVRIANSITNNIHNLVGSQNSKLINEKEELNELNQRLNRLVDALKDKKCENEELEKRIYQHKEHVINSGQGAKRQLESDLDHAKKDLNEVSELSSIAKIKASRSLYDLHRLKEKFDDELKFQTNAKEKIRNLENQRAQSLHELSFLRENFESKQRTMLEDASKNEKLRDQIRVLNDNLDREQERRIDLECRIQTLLEHKKFDQELNEIVLREMQQMSLNQGNTDPINFYNNELRDLKERIREDFNKLNEYNFEIIREEYERKCTTVIEEMLTKQRQDELRRDAEIQQHQLNLENLQSEYMRNEDELNQLRSNQFRLNKILEELMNRRSHYRTVNDNELCERDDHIGKLNDQIKNLKNDMTSMLGHSKSLDAEVAVYARLLNQRFYNYINENEPNNEVYLEKMILPKPPCNIHGNNNVNQASRSVEIKQHIVIVEQTTDIESDLIKKKLRELDEQKRLREEEERKRMKELEEYKRRQREEQERREIEERKRRELEEQRRRELEEQRRREMEEFNRRQRELEEQRRREEEQRRRELEEKRRRELEEQRKRELEEQRRREIEEQRRRELEEQRKRELEEKRRKELEEQRRREHEEQVRKEEEKRRRELEEQRRRELEEQRRREALEEQRLREIEQQRRELEELNRRQRELEEQTRRQRELEEQRRLRELEEQEELKRRQLREEQARRQRELEEQKRLREFEEKQRREEQYRREIEEQRRREEEQRREVEEQRARQRDLEEQNRRLKELEEQKRKQRELEELNRRQKQLDEQTRRQKEIEAQIEQQKRQRELQLVQIQEERHQTSTKPGMIKQEIEVFITQQQHKQPIPIINNTCCDLERQEKIKCQREEHEKYIIEKLRQEQELIEIQKRKKILIHNHTSEAIHHQSQPPPPQLPPEVAPRRIQHIEIKQHQHQQPIIIQTGGNQQQLKCVDKISSYTQHIIEEKHQKSSEFYEERHIPVKPTSSVQEKQINIRLMPLDKPPPPPPPPLQPQPIPASNFIENKNIIIRTNSSNNIHNNSRRSQFQQHQHVDVVDHCVSSNNGNKKVLIVNTYSRPKSLVSSRHNASDSVLTRSQSPPLNRNNAVTLADDSLKLSQGDLANKYAIKHKANRYVSGAIGILETSLNGEFIILENLSSNKTVNLKGWYIHRYVPDQNINVIYKFNEDCLLTNGEKLKILSKTNFDNKYSSSTTKNEKILVADNVKNWGKYSKFSVTKLINPEGVDKAVLTQSLLRLSSSSTNVNKLCQNNSSSDVVTNVKHINVDKNLIKNSEFIHSKNSVKPTTVLVQSPSLQSCASNVLPNHHFHQLETNRPLNHSFSNNNISSSKLTTNNVFTAKTCTTTTTKTVQKKPPTGVSATHLHSAGSYTDLSSPKSNFFTRQF